ncbi:MAG: MBOAT family protein [Anaerolineae bacterium]|nr:MBOAT family protein [Anaerolineae bacterium]
MSVFSLEFSALLIITVFAFYTLPMRFQWWIVLGASVIFYVTSSVTYAVLIAGAILIDFFVARAITKTDPPVVRKRLLGFSLILNIGLLFFFKYFNFFSEAVADLLAPCGVSYEAATIDAALPLGISFITFAKIGYMLDVYNRTTESEKNIGSFFLFLGFFPNITAGPIERARHLLPQVKHAILFDEHQLTRGLRRILWGAFKKVVIAERLAVYVNGVFDHPHDASSVTLILGILFFTFQIYADFSGYTDIARGIAALFGVELFENFRQPYFAFSILDFWRRWHISLTNWIREFMFMPLSRYFLRREWFSARTIQVASYIIVMSVIGLWHGANWTFVVWGLIHGILMGVETTLPRRWRMPQQKRLPAILQTTLVFIIISLTWTFFRANTLADASYVLTHLFASLNSPLKHVLDPLATDPITVSTLDFAGFSDLSVTTIKTVQLGVSFGLIGFLLFTDWLTEHGPAHYADHEHVIDRLPGVARWTVYYGAIALVFASLNAVASITDFVYVQF